VFSFRKPKINYDRIHDYRKNKRRWGHDISYRPMKKGDPPPLNASGFGHGLHEGDIVLLTGGAGVISPYYIRKIGYYGDPSDMWNATLEYAGDDKQANEAIGAWLEKRKTAGK
jgi:hypothetical protein